MNSANKKITAKTLLLDLLGLTAPNALPVRLIIDFASIFGLKENVIRVNIVRLAAKDYIEQDERGYYRLAAKNVPLHSFVNAWREGEKRTKPWQGDWLAIHGQPGMPARVNKILAEEVNRFGFREVSPRFWVRPNNLSQDIEELREQIVRLAKTGAFLMTVTTEIYGEKGRIDPCSLWPVEKINKSYGTQLYALERSMESFEKHGLTRAIRESYLLGGQTVGLLSMDPLLPEELVDTGLRSELTELMKRYDRAGAPYWQEFFDQYRYKHSNKSLAASVVG